MSCISSGVGRHIDNIGLVSKGQTFLWRIFGIIGTLGDRNKATLLDGSPWSPTFRTVTPPSTMVKIADSKYDVDVGTSRVRDGARPLNAIVCRSGRQET